MELNREKGLKKAILLIEKCNSLIGEMRSVDNRKKTLEDKIVGSAIDNSQSENESKEIVGLEKVLETMEEELDKKITELGKQMEALKSAYRETALEKGIGNIAEAVPK